MTAGKGDGMPKKTGKNTKARIVQAAWKLFYDQGYENTTVEDILAESHTSRGSFYHYFESKDALLSSLSMVFDEKYDELSQITDSDQHACDLLLYLNRELFSMIENQVSLELLARLLSSQLIIHGERHLLDRNRTYFRLLHQIIKKGQERGEISDAFSATEIVSAYAMFERALMYDWCLNNGSYSLSKYASTMMPLLLSGYRIG